ncbi:MAG: 4Fe-4S binding protein [Chloroflexi bacterium]|nr:4Fe-4S binding protein [Chloroflexota bacterium]
MASRHRRVDKLWIIRLVVQAVFAAYVLYTAVVHALGIPKTASLHALCPFGAVESLWSLAVGGAYLPKIHPSSVVLSVGVLAGALIVGGAFCGWICPLGSLGDALAWLRHKLHIQEVQVPPRLDIWLRYGRYLVLIGILVATVTTASLWYEAFDPYYVLFRLGWLFDFNLAANWPGYLVTLGVLAGSLFIPRLWCRYLCPLGGLLSLVQRISPFKVRRNAQACIDCKRCDKVCPVKLPISTRRAVTHNCTMCLRCVTVCPAKGALEAALPGYEDKSAEEVAR